MRIGLSILLIVFSSTCSTCRKQQRDLKYSCCAVYSVCDRLTADTLTVFHSEEWNIRSQGTTTVSFLEKFPLQYLAIGSDTTRIVSRSRNALEPLRWVGSSVLVNSPRIYDRNSLPSVLHDTANGNTSSRWLVLVQDTNLYYVGGGTITQLQLDNDSMSEFVVQVEQGWYHSYMIYDSTSTGWQMKALISLPDRGSMNVIDLSIPGYIGLAQEYHGTGLGATDIHYFMLDAGELKERFTINSYYGLSFGLYRTYNTDLSMYASSDVTVRGDGSFHIKVEIEMNLYDIDRETESTFHRETLSYNLLRRPDGTFHADRDIPGFNAVFCTEGCDSTYFAPDQYAYARLPYLKTHGTNFQRTFLKDFEFDSTAYFR